MSFFIHKTISNQFYFVYKARNGQATITSECYTEKQSCKKGITSLKHSWFAPIFDLTKGGKSGSGSRFEIKYSIDRELYFNYYAKNGEIVGSGETYETMQSCFKGIRSVKLCFFSKTIDKTKISE